MDSAFAWSLYDLIHPVLLVLPRILAAMFVLPIFPLDLFSGLVRTSVAISLGLVLYPMAQTHVGLVDQSGLAWTFMLFKEIFIGSCIGYAFGAPLWALEGMGRLIDNQTGVSLAQSFDPFGGHEGGPTAPLLVNLGLFVLVTGGGLNALLSVLYESYNLWPLGSALPQPTFSLPTYAGDQMDSIMQFTVRLAAPIILMLVFAELSLGLINRVARQFNVFFFSMPLKGSLAVLLLLIVMSNVADLVRMEVVNWPHQLQMLKGATNSH